MSVPGSTLRVLALAAVLAATVSSAAPAGAGAGAGYVRVAHLSPDSPPVVVELRPSSGPSHTFGRLGYGGVSGYLRLPAGSYTVAVRPAAAPARSVQLSLPVTVADGGAYTVAGIGRGADPEIRVLRDDPGLPADGGAKVRVLHASLAAPVLDVAVADGPVLGESVPFATTTAYRRVASGRWTVHLRPAGGQTTTLSAELASGAVYSLLVLDGPADRPAAVLHLDAGRRGEVPRGGVEAGVGPAPPGSRPLVLGLGALLVAAGVALAARFRRRVGAGLRNRSGRHPAGWRGSR